MNADNFFEMYASKFRPLTEADGLKEWTPLIKEANPDLMRRTLEAIDDHHRRLSESLGKVIGAPRLGEIESVYQRVCNEINLDRQRGNQVEPPRHPLLWLLMDADTYHLADIRRPRSAYVGPIEAVSSICAGPMDGEREDPFRPDLPKPEKCPAYASKNDALAALRRWEQGECEKPAEVGP